MLEKLIRKFSNLIYAHPKFSLEKEKQEDTEKRIQATRKVWKLKSVPQIFLSSDANS